VDVRYQSRSQSVKRQSCALSPLSVFLCFHLRVYLPASLAAARSTCSSLMCMLSVVGVMRVIELRPSSPTWPEVGHRIGRHISSVPSSFTPFSYPPWPHHLAPHPRTLSNPRGCPCNTQNSTALPWNDTIKLGDAERLLSSLRGGKLIFFFSVVFLAVDESSIRPLPIPSCALRPLLMTRSLCNLPIGEPWSVAHAGSLSTSAAAVCACVMILLLRYTIGACLSRTRSNLWSPVVSTSSVPIRFAGTLPSPHPSSHLQQAVPCVCVCVCVCVCGLAGLAWLAGLREECEKCADSVTPILGWGFLIFHFWIALQYVSNIRHWSILLHGAWDQRSGSSTRLRSP
jgi:hypothetical protein